MKSKILVADDSITIQKIVAMAFEHEDTVVEGIGDGEEAYNKLDDFRPDIVLADVEMPGYNGFELSQKIKQSDDFHSTRVLLLASDFEEFDEDQFRNCLADDHISKPFKSDDIINKVKELLSVDFNKVDAESSQDQPLMDQHEEQTEDEVFSLPEDGLLDGTEDFSELAPDGPVKDALDDEEEVFSLPDTALIEEPVVLTNGESPAIAEPEVTGDPAGLSSSQTGEKEAESFELSAEDMIESADDILGQESEPQEKSLDELLDSLEEISQDRVSVSEEDSSATESRPSVSKASETLSEMIDNVRGLQELAHSQEDSVDQDSTSNQDESVDSGIAAEPETSEEEATPVVQNEPNGNGLSHPEETAIEIHSADQADAEIDAIVAEPEDLLQQIMPSSTLVSLHKRARPDSIRESLSYLSRLSSKEKQQTEAPTKDTAVVEPSVPDPESMEQKIEGQVRLYLNDSLGSLIESEFSELSDKIQLSVREVVRDVAPGIVRDVIRTEIDKIKNQE